MLIFQLGISKSYFNVIMEQARSLPDIRITQNSLYFSVNLVCFHAWQVRERKNYHKCVCITRDVHAHVATAGRRPLVCDVLELLVFEGSMRELIFRWTIAVIDLLSICIDPSCRHSLNLNMWWTFQLDNLFNFWVALQKDREKIKADNFLNFQNCIETHLRTKYAARPINYIQ